MAQLSKGFGFDLADAFSATPLVRPDFLQRPLPVAIQPKPLREDERLSRREGLQRPRESFTPLALHHGLGT
jgi:hypothetical protein